MKVYRKSMISGVFQSMDLPVTQEEINDYEGGGRLLQNCFPRCSPGEREFIKSGITPKEWNNLFPPEDEL